MFLIPDDSGFNFSENGLGFSFIFFRYLPPVFNLDSDKATHRVCDMKMLPLTSTFFRRFEGLLINQIMIEDICVVRSGFGVIEKIEGNSKYAIRYNDGALATGVPFRVLVVRKY